MATTSVMNTFTIITPKHEQLPAFHRDVLQGLSAKEKYLDSKYFYDENGPKIPKIYLGRLFSPSSSSSSS